MLIFNSVGCPSLEMVQMAVLSLILHFEMDMVLLLEFHLILAMN
jgi:hypothetical protein